MDRATVGPERVGAQCGRPVDFDSLPCTATERGRAYEESIVPGSVSAQHVGHIVGATVQLESGQTITLSASSVLLIRPGRAHAHRSVPNTARCAPCSWKTPSWHPTQGSDSPRAEVRRPSPRGDFPRSSGPHGRTTQLSVRAVARAPGVRTPGGLGSVRVLADLHGHSASERANRHCERPRSGLPMCCEPEMAVGRQHRGAPSHPAAGKPGGRLPPGVHAGAQLGALAQAVARARPCARCGL